MGVLQWAVANLLFPLQELAKGHSTVPVHRQMEETQWLSREALDEQQAQSLREFLQRIASDVPYYRELFAELGFDAAAVKSTADLQRLPFLDKAVIRNNTEKLKADSASGLKRFNTGGSSGEPLIFYLGNERVSHDVAAKRRATRWWDVDIGDKEIVVWGSPIELGSQDRARLLRDKLFRTELVSAFEMSDDNLQRFVEQIQASAPQMLFGYPSSLALIAEYARSHQMKVDDLGIKVAFVTSERLYDHQRESIEAVFGCPVANGYGGRDAGFIAHQCPSGSMHITSDDIVVEIVDAQGKVLPIGEKGEIVVTHMRTGEFPFVRYKTGDIGILSGKTCSCGRGLQVLEEIEGRSTDFIHATDGTVLHGLALIYVLRDLPAVKSFKIIQETVDELHVMLVADPESRSDIEQVAAMQFRQRLGADIHVSFSYFDEIPPEKSGKFRYVVSRVGQ